MNHLVFISIFYSFIDLFFFFMWMQGKMKKKRRGRRKKFPIDVIIRLLSNIIYFIYLVGKIQNLHRGVFSP